MTVSTSAVDEVEGENRAPVRRDFHRQRSETSNVAVDYPALVRPALSDVAIDGINPVIDLVAGACVSEIERVIAELSNVYALLRSEGERVKREIGGNVSIS